MCVLVLDCYYKHKEKTKLHRFYTQRVNYLGPLSALPTKRHSNGVSLVGPILARFYELTGYFVHFQHQGILDNLVNCFRVVSKMQWIVLLPLRVFFDFSLTVKAATHECVIKIGQP